MSGPTSFLWPPTTGQAYFAPPNIPRNGNTVAREYQVDVKIEREPLEIDTNVGRTTEPYSSASPHSGFTMDSEEADSSSETDEDLITNRVVEELEDGKEEDELKPAAATGERSGRRRNAALPSGASPATSGPKRRGRPPRNPALVKSPQSARSHLRSKTGCITCRKRKKKCDERHPECLNCEKNNIHCEGYNKKQSWISGKLTKQRTSSVDLRLNIPWMPPRPTGVFGGIEDNLDLFFFDHFHEKMSLVLTLRDDGSSNPFIDLVVPMAKDHKGLMHSLLALSASHKIRFDPRSDFKARKEAHFGSAISALRDEVSQVQARGVTADDEATRPLIAAIIFQCLIPISDGSTAGAHRAHFQAARDLITPRTDKFGAFAWEFWKYHDMSNGMTSLERPTSTTAALAAAADEAAAALLPDIAGGSDDRPDFNLPEFNTPRGSSGVMIGVCDGLYTHIARIMRIRDRIRARKRRGLEPTVEYRAIRDASVIGRQLLQWQSGHEMHSPEWAAAELYRETALVYLHRSLRASRPEPDLRERVRCGVVYLLALPADHPAQSNLLLPTFVLGCAAFEEDQRRDIEVAFSRIEAYSNLGNVQRAREVVQRVWQMMDEGDERSWDWETVKEEMNYDFLVT